MARIAKKTVANEVIDLSFGSITLREKKTTAQQLARVRGEGKRAAIVLTDVLREPDIDVTFEPGTPVFSLDPQDPHLVIRQLDGQVVRGYFKNGKFVEVW
ncbi:hypothetical protein [Duganella sp. HH105]|uniref:hypothetical protein n=1 Tax=Duganella sp. HH105 TaxID=1781067 RepID=UPI000877D943|nr:hypothetical protein [Duganella sp. HH105]